MKMLLTILLLLPTICLCQDRIPEKYIVEVTYKSGKSEVVPIKNQERKSNIPKPIVAESSVFYDGEYLLLNVKSIKILKTEYYSGSKKDSTNDYKITKVNYFDPVLGKRRIINVITDPIAERNQREIESNKKSIFAPSESDERSSDEPNKDIIKKPDITTVVEDTRVTSRNQAVYESDGKGNFKKLVNTGLILEGDRVKNNFNPDYESIDIDRNTEEYQGLIKFNLKKGCYIIEKGLNSEKIIVSNKIIPVKIRNQD